MLCHELRGIAVEQSVRRESGKQSIVAIHAGDYVVFFGTSLLSLTQFTDSEFGMLETILLGTVWRDSHLLATQPYRVHT